MRRYSNAVSSENEAAIELAERHYRDFACSTVPGFRQGSTALKSLQHGERLITLDMQLGDADHDSYSVSAWTFTSCDMLIGFRQAVEMYGYKRLALCVDGTFKICDDKSTLLVCGHVHVTKNVKGQTVQSFSPSFMCMSNGETTVGYSSVHQALLRVGTLVFNLNLEVGRLIHDYSIQALAGFGIVQTDDRGSTFMVAGRKGANCWTHVIRNAVKVLCNFAKLTDASKIKSLERQVDLVDAAAAKAGQPIGDFERQGSGAAEEGGGDEQGNEEGEGWDQQGEAEGGGEGGGAERGGEERGGEERGDEERGGDDGGEVVMMRQAGKAQRQKNEQKFRHALVRKMCHHLRLLHYCSSDEMFTRLSEIVLVEWKISLKMAEAANWYSPKPQTLNPKPQTPSMSVNPEP